MIKLKQMPMLRWRVAALCLLLCAAITTGCETASAADGSQKEQSIRFGQIYGSAGFLSSVPSGQMEDAPAVVLSFSTTEKHRTLVLTGSTGDYIALLEPGHYCVAAYTRDGKALELSRKQMKCFDVSRGKDLRLDVMLVR